MNKSVLILILCLIVLLSACDTQSNHTDPPILIPVQTHEELDVLLHSTRLSDEELAEFLDKNSYSTRGLNSREDVATFASPLLAVGYPILNNAEINSNFSLSYYQLEQRYSFFYKIDDISYRFEYTIYEEKTNRSAMMVVKSFDIDGRTIDFFQGMDCIVGEFYVSNYQIRVIVKGYSSIDNISFAPFVWNDADDTNLNT